MTGPGGTPDPGCDLVEVVTTVASDGEAKAIARDAVAAGVAACVNWFPVRSAYRWEGRIVEEDERLLILKTTAAAAARTEAWILARHPYDTPAVLRQPLLAASPAYAAWVRDSVAGSVDGGADAP